ncbi:MAG: hypothetical protein A3G34_11005 [Candidatus Lindowbacteria bacterium RIFCSPLOWO2_12_FULL_62_27]|nr:MAG: hypothetical protein A3I06_12005 [Candidatus Lindowbacteria bacterium RIFCSPLOWO2_02_FULL_62_12]OGH60647.1 MAG: hypothetical protein A3G34_11005 [Candidatus Lindowbacteria bacterium RIFCSPLOWO2_12_FULL_62_27]
MRFIVCLSAGLAIIVAGLLKAFGHVPLLEAFRRTLSVVSLFLLMVGGLDGWVRFCSVKLRTDRWYFRPVDLYISGTLLLGVGLLQPVEYIGSFPLIVLVLLAFLLMVFSFGCAFNLRWRISATKFEQHCRSAGVVSGSGEPPDFIAEFSRGRAVTLYFRPRGTDRERMETERLANEYNGHFESFHECGAGSYQYDYGTGTLPGRFELTVKEAVNRAQAAAHADAAPGRGQLYIGESFSRSVVITLTEMVHLLIGGETGCGKTTVLLGLIRQLIAQCVDIVLIDAKGTDYKGIESKLKAYVFESEKFLSLITALVSKMDERYQQARTGSDDFVPLVLVVDELADVVSGKDGKEIQLGLERIAMKGRAARIHLILATQRPDVRVLDGQLRDNLPCRLIGRLKNLDMSVKLIGSGASAKLPATPGRFIWSRGLDELQVQVPLILSEGESG